MANPVRVVKLGGSLLGLSNLKERILEWSDRQSAMTNVWIVGGGEVVEKVRQRDQANPGDPVEVHFECIELMQQNAISVQRNLSSWELISTLNDDRRQLPAEGDHLVLKTHDWMTERQRNLPASWNVTSDSIAVAVAKSMEAVEVVLLKSCDAPSTQTLGGLVQDKYVDAYFETAVNEVDWMLQLRFVNFRSANYSQVLIRHP